MKPFYRSKKVTVFNADCLKVIEHVRSREVALSFADPPFNIGHKYENYLDDVDVQEYEAWCRNWISRLWSVTAGTMALHGNDDLAGIYLECQRKYHMRRRAWVNWHYRFGQCGRGNFIDSRCHCLVFQKEGDFPRWNPESVLVDSDRKTEYGDKRIDETENGGRRLPFTIWGIPSDGPYWGRVQGNNKERVAGRPNQLPEVYLARLIKSYTDWGDTVFDPFGGTGTTAVVAQALGRKCITCDIDVCACEAIVERVKNGAVRV